ncbi:MAG TPA: hypothetical protein VF552_07030 [Allosphingosinicella sp.]
MLKFLPILQDGEGDHAKHGGGVSDEACVLYPSTTLRVVPLPTAARSGGTATLILKRARARAITR